MDEDSVLAASIAFLVDSGWRLGYRTRHHASGPIGGADAILLKGPPWEFAFIEAKGAAAGKEKRSLDVTNCLGALLKRVRFSGGYMSNEARSGFLAQQSLSASQTRMAIQVHASLSNTSYFAALPASYASTVTSVLDPAVATLLHFRVLLIGPARTEELRW